jgi:hypothetical protein
VAEALLRLWRPPAHLYSTEPPFDGWGNRTDTDPWTPTPASTCADLRRRGSYPWPPS